MNLLFCGDTFLRTVDGSNPFDLITGVFNGSTVCLNIETALKSEVCKNKHISLVAEEASFEYLPKETGVVILVNNHVSDSGDPHRLAGLLKKKGLVVVGPENPSSSCFEESKSEVEVFAAYFGIPRFSTTIDRKLLRRLRQLLMESTAKRKICVLHWGFEHISVPAPFQRKIAFNLIDTGADLIIGNHPHVPQGYESYKEKKIYYSLGNFNFWQPDGYINENNKWGYMVQYDIEHNISEHIPYKVNDNYQPYTPSQEEGDRYLKEVYKLSEPIGHIRDTYWFVRYYRKWFTRELSVWLNDLKKRSSFILFCKFCLWLFLPVQLKYYILSVLRFFSPMRDKSE